MSTDGEEAAGLAQRGTQRLEASCDIAAAGTTPVSYTHLLQFVHCDGPGEQIDAVSAGPENGVVQSLGDSGSLFTLDKMCIRDRAITIPDPHVRDLVKAADKLSAYLKCLEELKAGNTDCLLYTSSPSPA